MEHTITPHPGILGIAPYRAGKSAGAPGVEVVKLSSNENPFGPGDRALEAFRRAQGALNRYPDPAHTVLREAIGAAHGIDPETVVCGNGSDEILHLLAQAYLGPDADGAPTEAIMSEHGFLVYPIVTRAAGARPVIVQERTRVSDVDAILAAAGPRTRLVFLANPNNPTGTMIGVDELARLADGLPSQVLLVLDGAYAEFAEDYDGGRSLVAGRENVFITRTFSKLYGLGGLRIGWGHGPRAVVEVLNRIRGPFNLSEPQMAAAAAALTDHEHIRRTLSENARLRVWLAEALARAGVPSDPSQANFVLAQFVNPDMAHACDDWLQARGLLVRRVDEYGLAHCLRITVGDEAACRRVVHAVGEFMAARNAPADGEMFA